MKRLIIILITVALTVVYVFYNEQKLETLVSSEDESVLKVLPNISLTDLDERSFNLYSYIDNEQVDVLLVHFWGTWCAPCEAEFPALVRLAKKLKENKGIEFLFVAVDDDKKKVQKFIKRFSQFYPDLKVLIDNQKIYREKFGTIRVPETYVFNKFKKTLRKFSGAMEWEQDYFSNLLLNYQKTK